MNTKEADEKEIILIVDGADEYIKPKVDLFDQVLQYEKFNKKIIGIRRFRSENLKREIPFPGRPELVISLNSVLKESNEVLIKKIIAEYTDIISAYGNRKISNLYELLVRYVYDLKLYDLDLFSLGLLTEAAENPYQYRINKNQESNFSTFLDTYCKNVDKHVDLDNAAQLAFETFNLKKDQNPEEIDNTGWKLIGVHHSIRNYLIAKHVVRLLRSPQIEALDSYDFVYPHEVNSYIKQIINIDYNSQKKVLNGINNIWTQIDEKRITTKTHLCYLLGRFTNQNIADKAFQIIEKIEQSEEFKKIISKFDNYESDISNPYGIIPRDRPKLLFLRTIYISLIYLGRGKKSREYSKKYIEFCLRNPYQENLNRGFHLEYYGDIPYHPGESENLQHEDNLKECDLTFNKLIYKVELAISKYDDSIEGNNYYSMFEVELFTLCSLAQHRSVRTKNLLKESYRIRLSTVLDNVLKQKVLDEESKLWDYLLFVKLIVCNPIHINQGQLYNLVNGLKRRHRRGWELKGNMDKFRVERVSSHVWSAEDIAFLFLPETTVEKEYNKFDIIRMLHFHDSAEAFTADLVRGEKQPDDQKEELKWISIISSMGMVEEFSELYKIKELFVEFEGKTSVNARYANDCDKLECLLQAINYYIKDEISKKVFDVFTKNLKDELKTEWGKRIERLFLTILDGNYLEIEKSILRQYDADLS